MHKHGTKTTLGYVYLLMEKPLGRYFQVWSPYYQAPQLLWLEMALFSKKALHNMEKHS